MLGLDGSITSIAALPIPSESYRDCLVRIFAPSGEADQLLACLKDKNDNYSWVSIGGSWEIVIQDDMFNPIPVLGYLILSQSTWDYLATGLGTIAKDDRLGGGILSTTGALTNDENTIYTGTAFPVQVSKYPTITFGVQLGSTTQHELYVGLYKDANNYILFTSDNNGNIYARCKSAAAETAVDTGVVQDTSLRYYRIEVLGDGSVNFYTSTTGIEEMTLECNIATNVYAGTLQPYINHKTTENVAKEAYVTMIHHRQVR